MCLRCFCACRLNDVEYHTKALCFWTLEATASESTMSGRCEWKNVFVFRGWRSWQNPTHGCFHDHPTEICLTWPWEDHGVSLSVIPHILDLLQLGGRLFEFDLWTHLAKLLHVHIRSYQACILYPVGQCAHAFAPRRKIRSETENWQDVFRKQSQPSWRKGR